MCLHLFRRRGLRFRDALLARSRLLFDSNLLLDLRSDGIHVHLVHGRGIAEHLDCVLPHDRVEDGDLHQQAAERAFFGAAQISAKIAVLGLLDAVLTGDEG